MLQPPAMLVILGCWHKQPVRLRLHGMAKEGCTQQCQAFDCHAGIFTAPKVNSCDGQWRVDKQQNSLLWTVDLIDDSNRNGSMEVVVDKSSPDSFFPCTVKFVAKETLCDITVAQCTSTQTQQPTPFGLSKQLAVSSFEVSH